MSKTYTVYNRTVNKTFTYKWTMEKLLAYLKSPIKRNNIYIPPEVLSEVQKEIVDDKDVSMHVKRKIISDIVKDYNVEQVNNLPEDTKKYVNEGNDIPETMVDKIYVPGTENNCNCSSGSVVYPNTVSVTVELTTDKE